MASLVLGLLSLPMAFLVHLVSLGVVIAFCAQATGLVGMALPRRDAGRYTIASASRVKWGIRTGILGLALGGAVWYMWVAGVLP